MGIRVVERGPFGCVLDRGSVESMERIPEGYKVVGVLPGEVPTVYVEPVKSDSAMQR